jgi:hypothetical protein
MIKLLVERDRPPTFNLADDKEAARHARIERLPKDSHLSALQYAMRDRLTALVSSIR